MFNKKKTTSLKYSDKVYKTSECNKIEIPDTLMTELTKSFVITDVQ